MSHRPKTRAVAFLLSLGMTQQQLANRIGKPACQGNVSRILREVVDANREYIEAFRAVGCEPAWWFEPAELDDSDAA